MINNNIITIYIYFHTFIFMLNFFLLFEDCILQTINNDIKSSNISCILLRYFMMIFLIEYKDCLVYEKENMEIVKIT